MPWSPLSRSPLPVSPLPDLPHCGSRHCHHHQPLPSPPYPPSFLPLPLPSLLRHGHRQHSSILSLSRGPLSLFSLPLSLSTGPFHRSHRSLGSNQVRGAKEAPLSKTSFFLSLPLSSRHASTHADGHTPPLVPPLPSCASCSSHATHPPCAIRSVHVMPAPQQPPSPSLSLSPLHFSPLPLAHAATWDAAKHEGMQSYGCRAPLLSLSPSLPPSTLLSSFSFISLPPPSPLSSGLPSLSSLPFPSSLFVPLPLSPPLPTSPFIAHHCPSPTTTTSPPPSVPSSPSPSLSIQTRE